MRANDFSTMQESDVLFSTDCVSTTSPLVHDRSGSKPGDKLKVLACRSLSFAVGQDYMVFNTRAAILRSAGYVVESAYSAKQALDQFLLGDFDLVILCHSVPLEERQSLIRLIRAYGSAVPVLHVAPLAMWYMHNLVDGTVESSPDEFLRGVQKILDDAMAHYEPSTTISPKNHVPPPKKSAVA